MNITVVICTYNRCRDLPHALRSVAASIVPAATNWEVIVVDNNSSDETREVVQSFCRANPPGRFRYAFEPRQGLSQARNAGIREARGDVIAFTDDDVTVEPTWLENLTANLHSTQWAGAGGRVHPPKDFTPPQWLTLDGPMDVTGPLAWFDRGNQAGELRRAPYGANMAFQRRVFEKYGGFRTDLGRCGDNLMSNEETEFALRLTSGGERLRYEPSALVYHPISEERLTTRYLREWWFSYGRAMIRQSVKRPSVWGIPRAYISMLSRSIRIISPALCCVAVSDPRHRFWWKTRIWAGAGEIVETFCQCRAEFRPHKKATALQGSAGGS
jgi:glucosyl-dolichyl phosphate glucuronosyltransferase